MSLLNKASLIQIPSGYKDGTLYSAKPTNGDGDFTFSRGSNLAATRVNSEGLIEKGRENLLLQSNSFDTTWASINTNETGGQAGYDGTNDAWLITKSAALGRVQQSIATGGVQTLSTYAKAGSLNWLRLQMTTSNTFDMYYDLQNGVLGSSQINAPIDATITSVGNGWYRCSITADETLINVRIYPADDDEDLSGTSGNIIIQDAQLELGLVATDYIETTTTTAQAGILEDMPRLDYSGGASCPSLKLEPERSNSVTESEYFENWNKNGVVTEQNQIVSPDGDINAAKYQGDGTNSPKMLYAGAGSVTSGTAYTWSVFVKKGTLNFCQLIIGSAAFDNALFCNFDLANGTIGSNGGGALPFIEPYGNDWYRVGITATADASTTATPFVILANSATMSRVNGFATSDYIYVYGAQFEQGSYPTSYIPTYGSSVTRSADSCSKTGISSLIGQSEGTMFVEFEFNKDIDAPYRIALSDGTTSNRIQLGTYGNEAQVYVQTGGVTQVFALGGTITTGTHKMVLAYAANDYVAYLDGSAVITDTSASVPACSQLEYEIPDGTGLFEHPIKQQLLFPTRLTNDELAALTTL